ncbi:hypothetical protein A2419_02400 [Candidatus Adlerbacteria bacterium RIFOXYC1_FULL_48_26]|uniref:Probable peptidoglycan glycosyltransferase FtsW n=1 Tax=Candidatus Adlerbacteria bacterium RIFOXYC1_FULL_48_26 TaxID=1797247 RepID=A0A1F4Y502_9BACT|nr:MAG: hypothetical protein A2419_02400 [Candidatus Adlerbacteria bacterium RIFOXYC1_FULL_48_26]OGC96148.1 MAG: hypothetical protein A2590_01555 [Candidatus Adlerbacteria bacterium RIFOXYD1_FULL_48_8]
MSRRIDKPFLFATGVLVISGLLIFTSAALGQLARDGASFTSVAVSQLLLGFVCGSILLLFFMRLDYKLLKRYTPYIFAFAFFLTLLTFVPGIGLSLKGASRWITIGGFSFQPEELLKLATILFLAAIYSTRAKTIQTLKGGILPMVLVTGSVAAVLIAQPNTDGVVIIGMASAAILFAAGGRISHLLMLAGVGLLVVIAAAFTHPHVASRIQIYLNHGDPQGAGYQVEQSLIAIGSGGFSGRGFGQGVEKFSYLPEPIGDSIFAVVGEEFGFVGSSLLVMLFALFTMLGLRIAARASDPFGGLLVVGLVILIAGQSFFNIASSLALVPLIGLPLIFVSHGGTALALALAEVGIILSVSRHMRSPASGRHQS